MISWFTQCPNCGHRPPQLNKDLGYIWCPNCGANEMDKPMPFNSPGYKLLGSRDSEVDHEDFVEVVQADYLFRGIVVCKFKTIQGQLRYVVQNNEGLFHIYSAKSLKVLAKGNPREPVPTFVTSRLPSGSEYEGFTLKPGSVIQVHRDGSVFLDGEKVSGPNHEGLSARV